MNSISLYLTTVMIWGSTFYAIKFQLGVVDPLVSVAYRFLLAGLLLLGFCRLTGMRLSFSRREHGFMLLQGLCLFGINYWLMYQSTAHLTSGLIALTFSTIVMMNIVNGALFLGQPVRKEVVIGGLLGLIGIALVFQPAEGSFNFSGPEFQALLVVLLGTYCASLGNICSARNQRSQLPVIQTNAFGMSYGGLAMLVIALLSDKPLVFDTGLPYLASLAYLSLFGSIVAFGCYLTLVGRIGADRAAYATLLFPIVALQISTWLEGYQWSPEGLVGMALVLLGNLIILVSPQQLRQWRQRWLARSC
ncbi:DMT family transporter [Motiliproteus sp.]|uniref:DMT family transporter n=1 Tax=Motiliproteus sp. TaxID=1898955 RepID=UPI003BAD6CE3